MTKLLMTAAVVGVVAFAATPAKAEVELGLGGHFKGYVSWVDADDAPGVDTRTLDIIRETEVHFTGETVLDNGLTVGFHVESEADGGDGFEVEESYAYFAGNWGRVNFGAEDGAAYLLQVAAPSADSNVDGIRAYVDGANWFFDYDHAASGYSDKLTYITPVFNGFQAGASYTPDAGYAGQANGLDDVVNAYGDIWEVAARYEGQFNAVRLTLGGGYSLANLEAQDVAPTFGIGDSTDDIHTWNVGANFGFGPFNVGAAYLDSDNGDLVQAGAGVPFVATDTDSDTETWVLGVDYTTGPFVIGASYYNTETDVGAGDFEGDRYSGGVTYTYGPGMTFRGSVHHIETEAPAPARDIEDTQFLLGTQIGF